MTEFTAPKNISELHEFLRPTPQIRSDERLQDDGLRQAMAFKTFINSTYGEQHQTHDLNSTAEIVDTSYPSIMLRYSPEE